MAHVRPFFRRNYLNEMLCIKHYDEFREHLPCYWNERKSLEYFLVRCGYFALDDSTSLKATKITCKYANSSHHFRPVASGIKHYVVPFYRTLQVCLLLSAFVSIVCSC
uniref:Uncharacterized protein n=1 Tax=Parascaris univalens TaxID=6257 RepID=A0A915C6H2_PARUN